MKKGKYQIKSEIFTITPTDENDLWEKDWIIAFRKGDREIIGKASFAGEKQLGAIPLYVELLPRYRNQGYGRELIKLLVNWAFLYRNIFEVVVTVDRENDKAVNALERVGFVRREWSGKEETYSIIKEKSNWLGIYIMIGMVVGTLLGIAINYVPVGFCIGMLACILIGKSLDTGEKKYRESVVGGRLQK